MISILSTHIHGLSAADDRNTLLDNLLVIEVAYSSYLLLSGQANMSTVNKSMSWVQWKENKYNWSTLYKGCKYVTKLNCGEWKRDFPEPKDVHDNYQQ